MADEKTYKVRFTRGYGGWTDKAVVVVGTGVWIPRKYCTNWTESKPPKELEAELPEWLYEQKKNVVELIEE